MLPLSICIPTFNRISDLDKCLRSITAQIDELQTADVEVVVSDNASTDGTEDLLREYASKHPYLRYSRNDENIGYAKNINNVVASSKGKYCWLLGSDDELWSGSLAEVLKATVEKTDIILGNPVTHGRHRRYLTEQPGHVFYIKGSSDFAGYINKCTEISAAFAFISTIVVKKDFWDNVALSKFEYEHPYTHMLRICKGLTSGGTIFYLGIPLISTGYNDNEWNRTILPYLRLDIGTIGYIVSTLYTGDTTLNHAYATIFKNQYEWQHILKARVECDSKMWSEIEPTLRKFGYSPLLLQKRVFDKTLFSLYLIAKRIRRHRHSDR
jgi:abequosyltransferase